MKYLIMLIVIALGCGCTSTETLQDIHAELSKESEFLRQRHLETIDAYIASLNAAKVDIKTLGDVIVANANATNTHESQLLESLNETAVQEVVLSFEERAQKEILDRLDQKIEEVFWPAISRKHEEYRDKADKLGKELKSHPCATAGAGCNELSFESFQTIDRQYRDYSTAAEYILHVGYEQETLIWQRVMERMPQFKTTVRSEAAGLQTNALSNDPATLTALTSDFDEIAERIDQNILDLQHEKTAITEHWTVSRHAMDYMQQYINKPDAWELVLSGASTQVKSIVASYSSVIRKGVGNVLGDTAGQFASQFYESEANKIIDNSVSDFKSAIDNMIHSANGEANRRVNEYVDKFNSEI